MNSEISTPVGGVTDRCGICGRPISAEYERGLIGLNAVLCTGCSDNINLFTAFTVQFRTADGCYFRSYTYGCYPDTPYWDAAASAIFIDTSSLNLYSPEEVTNYYQTLSPSVKEALWYIASVGEAESLTKIEPAEIDRQQVQRAMDPRTGTDDNNPYTELLFKVPEPKAFDGTALYGDFSNADIPPSEVKAELETGHQTESQANLGSFDAVGDSQEQTRESPSTTNSTSSGSGTNTSDTERSGQTSLTVF